MFHDTEVAWHLLRNGVLSAACLLVTNIALRLWIDRLRQSLFGRLGQRHREHDIDLKESVHQNSVIPALKDERNQLVLYYPPRGQGDADFPRVFVVSPQRPEFT